MGETFYLFVTSHFWLFENIMNLFILVSLLNLISIKSFLSSELRSFQFVSKAQELTQSTGQHNKFEIRYRNGEEDLLYVDDIQKSLPTWLFLPSGSSVTKKQFESYSSTLYVVESYFGMIAMVVATLFLVIESSTGMSISDQLRLALHATPDSFVSQLISMSI